MDAYFQSQGELPHFRGGSRQRGSGLGTLALAAGSTALPVIKKLLLPAAKRFGKELLLQAAPEAIDVLQGKQSIKKATKRSMKKTAIKQIGGGVKKRKIVKKKNKTKRRQTNDSKHRKKKTTRSKKTTKRKKNINQKTSAKRSRLDIFENLS